MKDDNLVPDIAPREQVRLVHINLLCNFGVAREIFAYEFLQLLVGVRNNDEIGILFFRALDDGVRESNIVLMNE